MGTKKLIKRLLSKPKDFTFEEAETLLYHLDFYRDDKGKTSGSRVAFISKHYPSKIILHRPHPRKELLSYQIKQLIEFLNQEGLL